MNPQKISIIGIGLIGGSIAKALKKANPEILIASLQREDADLHSARKEGVVDLLFASWEELVEWSQWIILASPLSTLSSLAQEIAKHCLKTPNKELLVIDVSSVKKAVFPTFLELTSDNLEFLSTHPMAGKETWGFENSDASLFQGRSWILSPHRKNREKSIASVVQLIAALGGKAVFLDPEKHDKQIALVSHLPALLSRLYLEFTQKIDPEALGLAGPGFQSMTRLAKDNPQLQNEIGDLNRKEILKHLFDWVEFINLKKGEVAND